MHRYLIEGGAGTGFSSEIETSQALVPSQLAVVVARELASHLRLKQIYLDSWGQQRATWRGNWLLI